ncbi:hypothetical protein [Caulobacter sp. BK020]|uniref:hypothetical protein n=1 Tax=Caulobacter sp. BK020 TaxID=2512117 RepID=UPI00104AD976|nr:hypothetical protein [Caulobacter sp. BK020]TCS16525.1 hypothetical protein EV278_10329 [Caulobacter sp. BK020]
MAEKRNEMSSEYYSHKRTTLLCSTALFVLALPGVKFGDIKYADFVLRGVMPGFVLFSLFVVTIYYFINFLFLWHHEASAYLRNERTGQRDLFDKIEAQISALERHGEQIERHSALAADAITWARSSLTSVIDPAQQADHLNTQHHAFGALDPDSPEVINATSGIGVQLSELGKRNRDLNDMIKDFKAGLLEQTRVAAALLFSHLYHERFRPATDRLLGNAEVERLALTAGPEFAAARSELEGAISEVRRFRSDLVYGNTVTRLRLYAIDLGAPIGAFVLALVHVIGLKWPICLDLPHQLAAWGLIH